MVLKISDFSMTKDIRERDYHRVEDKSKPLPIRWMSLEAINYSVFCTKSDVVC